MTRHIVRLFAASLLVGASVGGGKPADHARRAGRGRRQPAEQVFQGELVAFPGPWGFLGKSDIILVSDQELETIAADPDAKVNLATSFTPRSESLRDICQRAQQAGHRTLIIAFDHFFRQYRPGQDEPRRLTPDMPEYVALIAKISQFAQQFGLGLELSLLSPLEIGPAYEKATGESGRWMHYRKGLRDPQTGAFSVQLWRQTRWTNNKGPIDIQDAGVRVFAFQEQVVAWHSLSCGPAAVDCRHQRYRTGGRLGRKYHRYRAADSRARSRTNGPRSAEPRAGRPDVSHAGNGLLQPRRHCPICRSSSTSTPMPACNSTHCTRMKCTFNRTGSTSSITTR